MKQPPSGFVVVDQEKWDASGRMFSDRDILDLAEGGLERIGLRKQREWLEEHGQAAMFADGDNW